MAEKIINLKRVKPSGNEEEYEVPTGKLPAVFSEEPLIEWRARDHIPAERSFEWYVGVIIVAAALIVYSILALNLVFAFFVTLATVALIAAAHRRAREYLITVFPDGVYINGAPAFAFSDVESFWIFPGANPNLLSLKPRRSLKINTHILLENVDPEKIRMILLNYLPEHEEGFPFTERLAQWMGF